MALLRAHLLVSYLKTSKSLIYSAIEKNIPKKCSQNSSYIKASIRVDTKVNNVHLTRNYHQNLVPNIVFINPSTSLASIPNNIRCIHTSSKRNALPPIILLLLRPVVNIAVIIFARIFRKWWRYLPTKQKEIIREKFRKNRALIIALMTIFFGSIVHFYLSHLEQDPLTKRWKFIAFTHEQMVQISNIELKTLVAQYEGMVLNPTHPQYIRVVDVANRILKSNMDVPGVSDKNWTITVVVNPTMRNAFVLPDGEIFIFTAMLDICDNDDQLGVILSHEISHAILNHMAEQLSSVQLVEWLLLIPLVIFWAVLPDGAALFSQWLSGRIASLMFHLPFSRAIETEADEIGLELAAKACFDIREASAFWSKMAILQEDEVPFDWLSTHPSNETRVQKLNSMMEEVIKRRASYSCHALPLVDPRAMFTEELRVLMKSRSQAQARDK